MSSSWKSRSVSGCGQITTPQELPSKKPALYVNKGCVFLVLLQFELRKLCFTSSTTRRTKRIKKVRDASEHLSPPSPQAVFLGPQRAPGGMGANPRGLIPP